jgi:hypothetical protein
MRRLSLRYCTEFLVINALFRAVQLMQLSDSIKEGLQPDEYEDDKEYAQVHNMTMYSHYIYKSIHTIAILLSPSSEGTLCRDYCQSLLLASKYRDLSAE